MQSLRVDDLPISNQNKSNVSEEQKNSIYSSKKNQVNDLQNNEIKIKSTVEGNVNYKIYNTPNDVNATPKKQNLENKSPNVATCNYSGRLDATAFSNTQRLFRDNNASSCAALKPYPGNYTGTFYYKTHYLTNTTGTSQCVTVTCSTTDTALFHVSAYKNSFNPADLSQNFIGDIGSSANNSASQTFSFIINAGQTIVLLINTADGTAMTADYTLAVSGLPCPPSCTTTGLITTQSTKITERISRDNVKSICGTPKNFPGKFTGSYNYNAHFFQNDTGFSQCVTVSATNPDATNVHFAAYLNSFDPSNLANNYLGDSGASILSNQSTSFTVNVPNGATLIVVAETVNDGTSMAQPYTINISGLSCLPTCTTSRVTASSATVTNRISRDGNHSSCATPKNFPGLFSGTYYYNTHYYPNTTGASQCVTIVASTKNSSPVHFSAYLNSFDPTNIETNYLGDSGLSTLSTNFSTYFSVNIPSGATLVVVALEANGGTMTEDYSLNVIGLPCPTSCSFSTQITSANPTMSNRLSRDAISSKCDVNKGFPGVFPTAVSYTTKTIINNTGTEQCLSIMGNTNDPISGGIHITAYNGSFDPNNIATNYLGDIGTSVRNGDPRSFNVKVPVGGTIILVMNNNNTGVFTTTGLLEVNITGITCSSILATNEENGNIKTSKKAILYPNPTEDQINVKGITLKSAKVFDASGKYVSTKNDSNVIYTQNLTKGLYIVQMTDADGNIIIDRFIKK